MGDLMTVTITSDSAYVVGTTYSQTEGAGAGHQMFVVPKSDPSIAAGVARPSNA